MGERMQGKTALITGATSNIGRAIAIAFAAEGANVAVSGRNSSRGGEVVQEITRAGGRAQFLAADLDGSALASRKLTDDATEALGGRIDVLVNNAGIFPGSTTPTVDEVMFDEVYAVNVKAPFFLTAAIPPEMSARGSGSIINLGSWVARLGIPVGALYASTKGAIKTLTRAWAPEFGSPGVRVNAISPGVVRASIENDPAAAMMRGTPYSAFGTPTRSPTPPSTSAPTNRGSSTGQSSTSTSTSTVAGWASRSSRTDPARRRSMLPTPLS